ncbi:phage tail tape measure protein [Furfurilactobacillus entadae]|uniref:phage tail tape measure protein n=1 Tax=Furfurilactobacillus entadae TaxID=2922307 RepID=UPI0035F0DF33
MADSGRPLGSMIVSLGMDGSQFENGLKNIQNQFKLAKSEMQANLASLSDTSTAYDRASTKVESLTKVIETNDAQIKSLTNTYEKQVAAHGRFGDAALRTATKIDNLERQQSNYRNELEQSERAMKDAENGTQSFRDQIDRMQREIKSSVDAFKSQGNAVQANVAEYRRLGSEIQAYDSLITSEKVKLNDLIETKGADATQTREQATRISELESAQTIAQSRYDGLGKSVANVSEGHAKAADNINRVSKNISSAGDQVKSAGQSMTGFSLVTGAAMIYGVKQSAEFQNKMVEIKNLIITGGESAKAAISGVKTMSKDAQTYSEKYGVSVEKIGTGYEDLVKRGYSSQQAIGAMKTELQGSVASGDDFNDVVQVASQTMESFGLTTDRAGKQIQSSALMSKNTKTAVNELAFAADKTSTDFQSLGVGMSYVGSTAHTAGLSLSETSAAMGILSNNGLEADKAGTGLRKVINSITGALKDTGGNADASAKKVNSYTQQIQTHQQKLDQLTKLAGELPNKNSKAYENEANQIDREKLKISQLNSNMEAAKQAKPAKNALIQLGINPQELTDAHGKLRSVSDIMEIINSKTKNMGQGQKAAIFTQLFGTTGQQAGAILAENAGRVRDLNAEVAKAPKNSYVEQLSGKNMQSAENQMKRFKETVNVLAMTFANTLLPAITKIVHGFTDLLSGMTKLSPGMKIFVSFGAIAAAALGPLLMIIGSVAKGISALAVGIGFLVEHGSAIVAFATGPVGIAIGVVAALGVAFKLAYDHIKPFRDAVNNVANDVKKAFAKISEAVKAIFTLFTNDDASKKSGNATGILSKILPVGTLPLVLSSVFAIKNAFEGLKQVFKTIGSTATGLWTALTGNSKKARSSLEDIFPKPVADVLVGTFKYIGSSFKAVKDDIVSVAKSIGQTLSPIFSGIGDLFGKTISGMEDFWNQHGASISHAFKNVFGGIVSFLGANMATIMTVVRVGLDLVSGVIKAVLDVIRNVFSAVWGNIEEIFRGAFKIIQGVLEVFAGLFTGNWSELWDGVKKIASGIWDGIQGVVKGALNLIVGFINAGIDGIDKVSEFFSGHATNIHHVPKLEHGTDGHEGGPMIVNDGKGAHYQELIVTPDGSAHQFSGRDLFIPYAPKGTQVIPGEQTYQYNRQLGIPHYENGIGGATDWIKGKISDIGSWIGDKYEAIDKFLKDPLKALSGIWQKATETIKLTAGDFSDEFGNGAGTYIIKSAVDWFKKILDKAKDEMAAPAGSGVQRWRDTVKHALETLKMPTGDDYINHILKQIETESGGNEKITQPGADPDGDGSGPAIGLMQTKRNTFLGHALPGHGDIFNGYDNLLSALSYVRDRYGISGILSVLGHNHGYANGGFVSENQMIEVAEGNKMEAIVPMDIGKRPRAMQILSRIHEQFGDKQASDVSINGTDTSGMGKVANGSG